MPRLVRAAALTNFVEVARSAGLDPWRMVREVGLNADCLLQPDLKIPMESALALVESAAARSGLEAFGLLMVEGRRISNLGVLGLLTREEPTLRASLLSASRFARVHNESIVQRFEEHAGIATIYEDLLAGPTLNTRQGIEMVVAVTMRLIKVFLGADWRARRICFTHPEPANLQIHRRVLGQTPEFLCDFNGIVCTSEDLDTPIASADPVLSSYLREKLQVESLVDQSVADEVRQMIMLLLPRGRSSVEQIAQLMGVHRKTLFRRLALEGQTYAALLQEIRLDLVQRYIHERRHAVRDLSLLLGFSEMSSFSRWYRMHFGHTAAQARRRAVQGPAPPTGDDPKR